MKGHFMSLMIKIVISLSLKNNRQEKVTLKFYEIKMGAPGN